MYTFAEFQPCLCTTVMAVTLFQDW